MVIHKQVSPASDLVQFLEKYTFLAKLFMFPKKSSAKYHLTFSGQNNVSLSLEVFQAWLDGAWSSLVQREVSLPMAGGGTG